jgi:alkylation response protein AidB-like acyl-CoA dehydrogenase
MTVTDTTTPLDLETRLRQIEALEPEFRARARADDDAAAFPEQNFAALRAAGLLALTAPAEYGGDDLWWGTNYEAYYRAIERLARVDSSTAQLLQVHSHALGYISRHAPKAQLDQLLPNIIENGLLLASVGSETNPRAARPGEYTSELVPSGSGWRLTCHKFFASLGPAADHLLIWVAVPGEQPYPDRTVTVLVPRHAPEVELIDQWDVMGMRPTVSWAVKVTDLELPSELVIGEPGDWVLRDPRTFTLGFTANHVGAAQAALDVVCEFVRQRPYLADSEFVQIAVGDLASDVFGVRSALYEAARAWERDDPAIAESHSLKALHLAKRVLLDTTSRGFDICGARMAFRDYPLEQMYRDARTFTLHFRDEINTRELGKAVLADRFSLKGGVDSSVLSQRNA